MSEKRKKFVSLALALSVVLAFMFSFAVVTGEEIVGTASASDLGDNITSTINEYVPLAIGLAIIGAGLSYLGFSLGRRYS